MIAQGRITIIEVDPSSYDVNTYDYDSIIIISSAADLLTVVPYGIGVLILSDGSVLAGLKEGIVYESIKASSIVNGTPVFNINDWQPVLTKKSIVESVDNAFSQITDLEQIRDGDISIYFFDKSPENIAGAEDYGTLELATTANDNGSITETATIVRNLGSIHSLDLNYGDYWLDEGSTPDSDGYYDVYFWNSTDNAETENKWELRKTAITKSISEMYKTQSSISELVEELDTHKVETGIALALVDDNINASEQRTIQKILDEETARIEAIQERVDAENSLDGRISAEEAALATAASDIRDEYKAYSEAVTNAMLDGEMTDDEYAILGALSTKLATTRDKFLGIESGVDNILTGGEPINLHADVTIGGESTSLEDFITAEADARVNVYSGTADPYSSTSIVGEITEYLGLAAHLVDKGVSENDYYIQTTTKIGKLNKVDYTYDITLTYQYTGTTNNKWLLKTNNYSIINLADLVDGKRTVFSGSVAPVKDDDAPKKSPQERDLWIPEVSEIVWDGATAYDSGTIVLHANNNYIAKAVVESGLDNPETNTTFWELYYLIGELYQYIVTDNPNAGDLEWIATTRYTSDIETAQSAADQAQIDATAAKTALADIANDSILDASEKPQVIKEKQVLDAEESSIVSKAGDYEIAQDTIDAYTNSLDALGTYLSGLGPVAWDVVPGNTTIDRTDFTDAFGLVYSTRQNLFNAIYSKAKSLADTAQDTANRSTFIYYQDEKPFDLYAVVDTPDQYGGDSKIPGMTIREYFTSEYSIDDMWIDTNNKNQPHRWDGNVWEEVRDTTDADNIYFAGTTRIDFSKVYTDANTNTTLQDYITAQIDSKVNIYSGTDSPANHMTAEDVTPDDGDLYLQLDVDKVLATTGTVTKITVTWKYVATNTEWVETESSEELSKLADLTDGKRTIFSNASDDEPTDTECEENDIWIPVSGTNDIEYVPKEIYIYSSGSWELATKYSADIDEANDRVSNAFSQITNLEQIRDGDIAVYYYTKALENISGSNDYGSLETATSSKDNGSIAVFATDSVNLGSIHSEDLNYGDYWLDEGTYNNITGYYDVYFWNSTDGGETENKWEIRNTVIAKNISDLYKTQISLASIVEDFDLYKIEADENVTAAEQRAIEAVLAEESARIADIEARIIAEANLDGKIYNEEAARIQASADLTAAYQEYSAKVAAAMVDDVIDDDEAADIAIALANVNAIRAKLSGMISDTSFAQGTADGRLVVWYENDIPYDPDDMNQSQYQIVTDDKRIGGYDTIYNYFNSSDSIGDRWVNTAPSMNNITKEWLGVADGGWADPRSQTDADLDKFVGSVVQTVDVLSKQIDGTISIYRDTVEPTGTFDDGDIFINTTIEDIGIWSSSTNIWDYSGDATELYKQYKDFDPDAFKDGFMSKYYSKYTGTNANPLAYLDGEIDGYHPPSVTDIYGLFGAPTESPNNLWLTSALKNNNVGNVWVIGYDHVDLDGNTVVLEVEYRWDGTNWNRRKDGVAFSNAEFNTTLEAYVFNNSKLVKVFDNGSLYSWDTDRYKYTDEDGVERYKYLMKSDGMYTYGIPIKDVNNVQPPADYDGKVSDGWVPTYEQPYIDPSEVTGVTGAKTTLEDTIKVLGDSVETNFAYNSKVNLDGAIYTTGFGLKAYGDATTPYESEFWINANRFRFADESGSSNPVFSIDGTTRDAVFNGKVSFTNVTNSSGTSIDTIVNDFVDTSVVYINSQFTYGLEDGTYPGEVFICDSSSDLTAEGFNPISATIKYGNTRLEIDHYSRDIYNNQGSTNVTIVTSGAKKGYICLRKGGYNQNFLCGSSYFSVVHVIYHGGEWYYDTNNFNSNTLNGENSDGSLDDGYPWKKFTPLDIDYVIGTMETNGTLTTDGVLSASLFTEAVKLTEFDPKVSTVHITGTDEPTYLYYPLGSTYTKTSATDGTLVYTFTAIDSGNAWVENGTPGALTEGDSLNAALTATSTVINGNRITTGSIKAQYIDTEGLQAESIVGNFLSGTKIVGASIKGGVIKGAIISASYIDYLDALAISHYPLKYSNSTFVHTGQAVNNDSRDLITGWLVDENDQVITVDKSVNGVETTININEFGEVNGVGAELTYLKNIIAIDEIDSMSFQEQEYSLQDGGTDMFYRFIASPEYSVSSTGWVFAATVDSYDPRSYLWSFTGASEKKIIMLNNYSITKNGNIPIAAFPEYSVSGPFAYIDNKTCREYNLSGVGIRIFNKDIWIGYDGAGGSCNASISHMRQCMKTITNKNAPFSFTAYDPAYSVPASSFTINGKKLISATESVYSYTVPDGYGSSTMYATRIQLWIGDHISGLFETSAFESLFTPFTNTIQVFNMRLTSAHFHTSAGSISNITLIENK